MGRLVPRDPGGAQALAHGVPTSPPRPLAPIDPSLSTKERYMLVHATVDKMTAMHLTAMADAFQRQLATPQFADLSFDERVGLLIDHEWTAREQRKLQRRLRAANLRHQASLEDLDWQAPRRGLDK